MKTVNATEMKNRLGEVLSQARREPVVVTTHGRPTHVVVSYEDYQALQPTEPTQYLDEIEDPEERVRVFNEMIDGMISRLSPEARQVDPGLLTRDRFYE